MKIHTLKPESAWRSSSFGKLALAASLVALAAPAQALSASPADAPRLAQASPPIRVAAPPQGLHPIETSDPDLLVREQLAHATFRAWHRGDFATLEALYAKHRNLSNRSLSGKPMIAIFGASLWPHISYPGHYADARLGDEKCNCGPHPSRYAHVDRQWDSVGAKIDQWISAYPRSSLAQIAKAHYFFARGHFYRGPQNSSKTRPEAWPILKKNMALAQETLSRAYALEKNPLWYERALTILGAGTAPAEVSLDVINLMVADGQAHAEPFINAMRFMQPQWKGSFERVDALARLADSSTQKTDRGATYARVYWGFATTREPRLLPVFFKVTKASWPDMRKSFEALVAQYPHARNYSGYAIFACLAGEAELSKKLLRDADAFWYFQQTMGSAFPKCHPR